MLCRIVMRDEVTLGTVNRSLVWLWTAETNDRRSPYTRRRAVSRLHRIVAITQFVMYLPYRSVPRGSSFSRRGSAAAVAADTTVYHLGGDASPMTFSYLFRRRRRRAWINNAGGGVDQLSTALSCNRPTGRPAGAANRSADAEGRPVNASLRRWWRPRCKDCVIAARRRSTMQEWGGTCPSHPGRCPPNCVRIDIIVTILAKITADVQPSFYLPIVQMLYLVSLSNIVLTSPACKWRLPFAADI